MHNPAAYVVSSEDQRGLLVITATLLMCWMVIVSLIRLYMRLALNGPLGWDDLAAFVGCVFGVSHVGTIMTSINHGLGQSLHSTISDRAEEAGQALFAANILFLAGHCAAKLSVCFLLKRLGRERGYLLWCRISIFATSTWAIASILIISILEAVGRRWEIQHIHVQVNFGWKAITATDTLTEALLVGLSMYLVWRVRMRWMQKAAVIFAFGTRLSLIAIAIVRQIYLDCAFGRSNLPLHLTAAIVTTEILLQCSIMAATIPCLKPFMIACNTGFGQGLRKNGAPYYLDSSTAVSHIQSVSHVQTTTPRNDRFLRPTITEESGDSDHSQQLIIRETREWTVEAEYIEMDNMRM